MMLCQWTIIAGLLISLCILKGCAGALSQKAAILNSVATPVNTSEVPDQQDKQPPVDNPEEFNYFPYDIQLDAMAYTSCEHPHDFTLKTGAYFSRSGLRLSDYFLKEKEKLDNTGLKHLIKSSTKHIARPRLIFAVVSKVIGSSFKDTENHFNFLLHDYIDELVNTGAERLQTLDGNRIEAIYKSNPLNPPLLWTQKSDLVLSYKDGQDQAIQRAPDEASRNFYGRIYKLNFREKLPKRYVLSDVTERKRPVETRQPEWKCPEDLQFEIRKSHQRAYKAQAFYDVQSTQYKARFPSLTAALQTQEIDQRTRTPLSIPNDEPICINSNDGGSFLRITRRVLGTGWNINISEGCVSPVDSSASCYKLEHDSGPAVIPVVSYDRGCNNIIDKQNRRNSKICPHQLSICIRNN